jgi:DNA repair photolyase
MTLLLERPSHLRAISPSQQRRPIASDVLASRSTFPKQPKHPVDFWHAPAVIAENHFVYKSLSNWAFNVAVGCSHACRFCYVPSTATIKQGPKLAEYGVKDPDAEWGNYVLLRPWDEQKFLASLRSAENTPRKQLKPDGNRAVIYCSTTDPYQVIRHPDPARQRELAGHARFLVRRSLELIRDESTLNVRILTRSPLARADFDLFQSFGKRLVFGMSLPTLRNDLAKVYEPKAPAPSQRLATLHAAKDAGLYVFVAMAPTYPECDEVDLRATLKAVAELKPITIFHEPINIRAENVARIEEQAADMGVRLQTEVFATRESWQNYAVNALHTVSELAKEIGISKRLHLWPDKSLGSQSLVERMPKPQRYQARLEHWWNRISEWPR